MKKLLFLLAFFLLLPSIIYAGGAYNTSNGIWKINPDTGQRDWTSLSYPAGSTITVSAIQWPNGQISTSPVSAGGGVWGSITGSISGQSDLQSQFSTVGISTGNIYSNLQSTAAALSVETTNRQNGNTALGISTGNINTSLLSTQQSTGTLVNNITALGISTGTILTNESNIGISTGNINTTLLGVKYSTATAGFGLSMNSANQIYLVAGTTIAAANVQGGALGSSVICSSIQAGSYPLVIISSMQAGTYGNIIVSSIQAGSYENIRTGTSTVAKTLDTSLVASYENIRVGTATIALTYTGNINAGNINAGTLGTSVICSSHAVSSIYPSAMTSGTYSIIVSSLQTGGYNNITAGTATIANSLSRLDFGVVVTSPCALIGLSTSTVRITIFYPYAVTIGSISACCSDGTNVVWNAQIRAITAPLTSALPVLSSDITSGTVFQGGTLSNTAVASGSAIYLILKSYSGTISNFDVQGYVTHP